MRVLVIGVKGQSGHDVVNELEKRGHVAVGVDIEEMDIMGATSVERIITEADVGVVIHCVAYTVVNAAEDNVGVCRRVNADDTGNVTRVCERLGIKMMYINAGCVFNGQDTRAWEPDDEQEPLNIYGLTKCEGELAVECHLSKYFIVRITWIFGVNGKNPIKTMLSLSKTHGNTIIMGDQVDSPIYAYDLAKLLVGMVETGCYGRYYAANEELCSRYEFACEIFKQADTKVTVLPVDSASYPSKAKRSMNSRMSKDKLEEGGFERLPSWQNAPSRYLQEIEY